MLRGRAADSGADLKEAHSAPLPAFLQAISVSLLTCPSEDGCDDYLRDRGREFWAEDKSIVTILKGFSTFNDWQEFGLCHQIFKYRYMFFLATWNMSIRIN